MSSVWYTYVEDFETGNIQYTNELDTLLASLEGLVDTLDEPLEETIEDGLGHGADRVQDLRKMVISHEKVAMTLSRFLTWLTLRPWVTNSLPTLILGLSKLV